MQPRPTFHRPLREGWDSEAASWIAWARRPGHDSYWQFHRDRFLELLPPPRGQVLDLGCGEGRVARDLASRGYRVVGIDRSQAMVRAAASAGTPGVLVADAAGLPFRDRAFDLVIAFMSPQDMDDLPGAVREAARVLTASGRLCLAAVHPLNGIGQFASREPDAPFVIEGSYFQERRYTDTVERDGLKLTFHQHYRPLQGYFDALEAAGLLTERVREVEPSLEGRWGRIPLFLHVRARLA